MKKEIVQYATGKFKHFDGQDREFTVCMVSTSPIAKLIPIDYDGVMISSNVTAAVTENSEFITEWERYVNFGISVRNPQDAYYEGIANKIAYGKANSKKGYSVAFDHTALMSTEVANALLNNFVSRVFNDPSLAIENYEAQKETYLKKCQKQENS